MAASVLEKFRSTSTATAGDCQAVSICVPCMMSRPTVQTDFCDISHGVLDSPNDRVHEQLELRWWQLEQRRKARRIDGTHHLEEANSVLGILCEILVDHVQSRLEYCVEDGADLRSQERLQSSWIS